MYKQSSSICRYELICELLIYVKLILNSYLGYEAWFDFLRTGLPVQNQLLDNRNPSAPGEVPSRFYYPEDEQALNTANYQEAIKRQGGEDNINTKLWWEK